MRLPRKLPKTLRVVDVYLKGVPRHIRDNFKAYCVRRGMSMKERIIELMTQDCNHDIKRLKASRPLRKDSTRGLDDEEITD